MKLTKEQLYDAVMQMKNYHENHASGGATELTALQDVFCDCPTEGQTLRFSEEDQMWHNGEADVGVELTKAEYDALPDSKYSDGVTYFIKDAGGSGGGSTGAGEMELTQAEYDALPDSKNTDGINYFITDGEVPGIIGEAGLAFDLLWKNSNSNSTFAAQTIELDLSAYGAVYIVYKIRNSTEDGAHSNILALIDDSIPVTTITNCYYNSSWVLMRHMKVSPTSILFTDGRQNGSTNNNIIIPSLIYGIKKASAVSTKNGVNYSTEEQVVGTWIDGKPLYQKTIVTNSPSTSATIFVTMDSNVDIQSIECKLNENESYRFSVPFYVASQTFASIYIRNRYALEWVSSSQYFNKECIVTVRYTKTTD